MKRNAFLIVLAGSALALAAWQLAPAGDRSGAAAVPVKTDGVASAAVQAGYVVHFDENGRIVEEPTPGSIEEMNSMLGEMVNTSQEGLVTVDSPVPGGGVMIDLQGRFQNASVATVDGSGKIIAPCLSNENEAKAFTTSVAAKTAAAKE